MGRRKTQTLEGLSRAMLEERNAELTRLASMEEDYGRLQLEMERTKVDASRSISEITAKFECDSRNQMEVRLLPMIPFP
eukprot:146175-Prorocentrum_minimum.AAC.7